jgi:ABC-type transport system involved in multi-copper enzyme maturation permease subunit
MTWLTLRQFRAQAVVGIAAIVAIAIYLVLLGAQIHHAYNGDLAQCRSGTGCGNLLTSFTKQYGDQVSYLGYLLIAVPGIIGMFWGAPLIARELEAGTHRLVWNQSVTRRRWLAAKLSITGLISIAVAGAYTLLLTWAAGPVDAVEADRFSPLLFDARNIALLGYAAFAFALGTTLGLFIRRTVPAMALTLVIFAAIQILVPAVVRPNYATPVDTTVKLTTQTVDSLTFFGEYGTVGGLKIPGAWIMSASPMLNAAGQDIGYTALYSNCLHAADLGTCFGKKNLHVQVSIQPASRYWAFQWYEFALFAALTAVLAALCFWRIRPGHLT